MLFKDPSAAVICYNSNRKLKQKGFFLPEPSFWWNREESKSIWPASLDVSARTVDVYFIPESLLVLPREEKPLELCRPVQ